MTDSKELFAKVSGASTDNEYFLPLPQGYQKGKTKYVIVTGTVMSGLGKGIFSSCLAKLLQDKATCGAVSRLESLYVGEGTSARRASRNVGTATGRSAAKVGVG